MVTMNMSTKMDHPPCISARFSLLSSAIFSPSWQRTRRMLTGVPMHLMTAHRWTASHSRCTSPSGHPAQDLTLHCLVVSTEKVVGWEACDSATAPDIRAWESQAVL